MVVTLLLKQNAICSRTPTGFKLVQVEINTTNKLVLVLLCLIQVLFIKYIVQISDYRFFEDTTKTINSNSFIDLNLSTYFKAS